MRAIGVVKLGVAGAIVVATAFGYGSYNRVWRYGRYLPAVRAYVEAAFRQDSASVFWLATDSFSARWILARAQDNPTLLRAVLDNRGVAWGDQTGDRTFVYLKVAYEGEDDLYQVRLVPDGQRMRIRLEGLESERER